MIFMFQTNLLIPSAQTGADVFHSVLVLLSFLHLSVGTFQTEMKSLLLFQTTLNRKSLLKTECGSCSVPR